MKNSSMIKDIKLSYARTSWGLVSVDSEINAVMLIKHKRFVKEKTWLSPIRPKFVLFFIIREIVIMEINASIFIW